MSVDIFRLFIKLDPGLRRDDGGEE